MYPPYLWAVVLMTDVGKLALHEAVDAEISRAVVWGGGRALYACLIAAAFVGSVNLSVSSFATRVALAVKQCAGILISL